MSDDLGCAIISAADEQSWTQASRRSTILQPAAAGPKRRSAFTFIRPRIAAKRTRKRAADYQGLAAAHDNEQGRGDHEKEGTDRTGQRKLQESGLRNASGARTCQGASDRTLARARPSVSTKPTTNRARWSGATQPSGLTRSQDSCARFATTTRALPRTAMFRIHQKPSLPH